MSSKIEAKIERLPPKYEWENYMMFLSSITLLRLAWIQFVINTWRVEYEKWQRETRGAGIFIPTMPRKIEVYNFVSGESCNMVCDRIQAYGIPYQRTLMQWELWPGGGGIGLRFTIWVAGPQWAFADCILAQHQGRYIVESQAGPLRPYRIGAPWGVPARPRSFDGWILNRLSGGALDLKKAQLKPVRDGKTAKPNKRPRLGANGHKGKKIPDR